MWKLLDNLKKYFSYTSIEQQDEDWEEIEELSDNDLLELVSVSNNVFARSYKELDRRGLCDNKKDITIDILKKKCFFNEYYSQNLYSCYIGDYIIDMHYDDFRLKPWETNWECEIYMNANGSVHGYVLVTANIQTVDQFNGLMEIFGIDLEL